MSVQKNLTKISKILRKSANNAKNGISTGITNNQKFTASHSEF